MADFNDPAFCTIFWIMRFFRFFFPAGADMGNVPMSTNDLFSRLSGVSGIGTQVGLDLFMWFSKDDTRIQDRLKLADIVTIRPGNDERQRDSMLVYQQMPLAPFFFPDQSDCFQLLLCLAVPSSWPHRCSATPKISLEDHCILPAPGSRAPRKIPLPTTHRNTDESHSEHQTPLWAVPST